MITIFNHFLNEKHNSMNYKLIDFFIQNDDNKTKQCLDFGADIELYNELYNFKNNFIKLLDNIKTIYILYTSIFNLYELEEVHKVFNNFDDYLLYIRNDFSSRDSKPFNTYTKHFFLDENNNVLFEINGWDIKMSKNYWYNIDSLTTRLSIIQKRKFMCSYFKYVLKKEIIHIQSRYSFDEYWERTINGLKYYGYIS